jgi:hypothetical protein
MFSRLQVAITERSVGLFSGSVEEELMKPFQAESAVQDMVKKSEIGYPKISEILQNLYEEYQEERYRQSPLLRNFK